MKKFLLLVVFISLVIVAFPRKTFAASFFHDGTTHITGTEADTINNNNWFNQALQGGLWDIGILVTGIRPDGKALVQGPNNEFYRNGALGFVSQNIASLYGLPPAETGIYLADLGARAGIVKPAYAQGIGFTGLSPILGLWKAFRNIAYGFLVIILVAVGFMIFFRMKIDPRTVINIQTALPRIVVTLILITFSYVIAALLIEAMYLLIFISLAAFRSAAVGATDNGQFIEAFQNVTGSPLFSLGSTIMSFHGDATTAVNGLIGVVTNWNVTAVTTIAGTIIGGIIGFGLGGATGAGVGALFGGGAGFINAFVFLIVGIALLFGFLRILFMLIMAYLQVVLGVIFGPLYLMFGAIPNVNAFGSWIRGMIGNLAVFPITSIMLTLAAILTAISRSNTNFWTPPGIGSSQAGSVATGVIGFGMILLIPNVVAGFKELIKAKSPLPIGSALGGAITTPASTAMQMLSTFYYIRGLKSPKPLPPPNAQEQK